MLEDSLDVMIRNYRRLTPAQRTFVQERAMERAKVLRAQALADLLRRLRGWLRRRSAITRLDALDDRMLKDLGLHRSEIEAAVRDATDRGVHRPTRQAVAPPLQPNFPEKPHLWLHRTG